MALTALRGALAFLTRLPVGGGERAWDAFRETPAAFPLAGYVVGAAVGATLLLPAPAPTVAALYLAALYALTGITHADGLADLGDAAAAHGDTGRRREAMRDPLTGVGGALAVALGVAALALGAAALVSAGPLVAVAVALAAEVGAKAGMATLICLGDPAHDGMGASFVGCADASALPAVAAVAAPALALSLAVGPAPVAALLSGPLVAVAVGRWARRRLGGASGDVLGAANELGRAVGLHAGVIAWTLS